MQKKETHLEVFKNALTSTVKSISEKKNCEITFGKPTSNVNNKNEINLALKIINKVCDEYKK